MTIKNLYKQENQNSQDKYEKSIKLIGDIVAKTQNLESYPIKRFHRIFYDLGVFILKMYKFEKLNTPEHFTAHSTLELMEENESFFAEILPENYDTSWTNPTHAVQKLGDNFGQLFSYFYTCIRRYISYAFLHKRFTMAECNEVYLEAFHLVEDNIPNFEKLKKVIQKLTHSIELKTSKYA